MTKEYFFLMKKLNYNKELHLTNENVIEIN